MSAMMQPSRRDDLLNRIQKPRMAKAKPDLNFLQNASRLLRQAIADSGLSHKQAMAALGVEHESQFSEMLDGKQKLWMHQLLRDEARPIWRELMAITARQAGYAVERVIRWTETA